MFDKEKSQVEEKIIDICQRHEIPFELAIVWNQIPFSGEWGVSTSFFQLAANEARKNKIKMS